MKKTLFLILKAEYFNQIKAGIKKEEYRLVTPYWVKRLVNREYSDIVFQLGYSKKAERIRVEYLRYEIKNLKHEFFGGDQVSVFALKLGKITEV